MKQQTLFRALVVLAVVLLFAASLSLAQEGAAPAAEPSAPDAAVGTAFTYQGQLEDGDGPANASCDFEFKLYDAVTDGSQVGGTVAKTATVSDGLFTVSLDFGAGAFDGDARWLEIAACCPSTCTPTTLDPRQELTPAPYALYAPPHNSLVAADGDPADAVYVDNDGNVGIGTTIPGQRLTVDGTVESTSGGFKFPDGTTQTTAASGGSGGDVKQLIQDFVVASGESVTAGDVVSFLDGYVQKGLAVSGVGDDINYGSETAFNPGRAAYISAAALSPTQFVVAYTDDGNSRYGTAVIGEVTGNAITYGSEYVFNSATSHYISVDVLSSTQFVVAYRDDGNSSYGTAVIGDVSGTTITYGSEYVFNSAFTYEISAAALSPTQFVVAYRDDGSSDYGTAVIGDVSGTTITYGSEYVFNSTSTDYTSVAALSSTQFVVAYMDDGNSSYGTAVIGDVSGTTITYGSEYVFNSAFTYEISAAALSSTQFVVAYVDNGNSNYGTAVIGDVSGTTITYGSDYVFNPASTGDISAAALSDAKFVVAYRDYGNSNYGTAVIGDVSGTAITYGSEYVFNSADTGYISAAALSSTQFVVAYSDDGNSYYGTAVIGDVAGTTITYGSEYRFNPSSTGFISAAVLSDAKFVVAYQDDVNSDYGTAVIGDVSGSGFGTTITYGSEYVFNPASTDFISVAALSDAKFVVAYQDDGNSDYGTAVIGDVSGTTISYGSEVVFNNAETPYPSVAALSSTKFVVAYSDVGNSDYGTAVIGDVSGTTITYGLEYVFNSASTDIISAAALSDAKFVVAYSDGGNYGTAVIGDVSGTTITYGSEHVFNSAFTENPSVDALSSTQFVVAYSDGGNSYYGTAVIGDVSGTTITYGSDYEFNFDETYCTSVAALSSTQFVVAYMDYDNSEYGTAAIGNVSGTTITYGSEYVFDSTSTDYVSVAALSTGKFVVAYQDVDYGEAGKAVIGEVVGGNVVGIAREAKTEGQTVPVIIDGVSDVQSGLTSGEIYYSDVSGVLTTSETPRRMAWRSLPPNSSWTSTSTETEYRSLCGYLEGE